MSHSFDIVNYWSKINYFMFSPNKIIKTINNILINVLTPIIFMKAGFSNNEYSYIGSFQRQVYLHPEYIHKLLSSLLINYE